MERVATNLSTCHGHVTVEFTASEWNQKCGVIKEKSSTIIEPSRIGDILK